MRRRRAETSWLLRVLRTMGLRKAPKPHVRYASLRHWYTYGLDKPDQWAAAEYGWQAGLPALRRWWCPARDRPVWDRGEWIERIRDGQRGRVYTKVCDAIDARRAGRTVRGPL